MLVTLPIVLLTAFSPGLHIRQSREYRVSHLLATAEPSSPVEALAASMTQAEVVSEELSEAAKEVEMMEAATAEELGLTPEELELFVDGEDEPQAEVNSPVQAMADLQACQEDASAALADGFQELEQIEEALAKELEVSVEELELVEDSRSPDASALLPEGFEWGGVF